MLTCMSTIVSHMRCYKSQLSCVHATMPLFWKAFTLFNYAMQFTLFKYAMQCCTGMEPHSALPVAMPMVFSDHCDQLPKGLRGIKILAHTAVSPLTAQCMQQHFVILPDPFFTLHHTEHQNLAHACHASGLLTCGACKGCACRSMPPALLYIRAFHVTLSGSSNVL